MSLTALDETYEDQILSLARDPDLNREKAKTSKIILIIQGFPIVERKVSRLCLLCLTILQTLEKIELNLKNWAFMSLDINSANHFDTTNTSNIKTFNNNVSLRVISSCQELTVKLNKITADMDFITKALRTLSPIEFISDSGTLLTSLTLRNIKLKDELREKVTIAYLKAKLITIGTDLEAMLADGLPEQVATVESYKHFVASLLNQLNDAVDAEDDQEKEECLAVINDMEQMFEVFKLETAEKKAAAKEAEKEAEPQDSDLVSVTNAVRHYAMVPKSAGTEHEDIDDLDDSSYTSHSLRELYIQPMVHSITKHSPETTSSTTRRGSFSSISTSALQKSTLTEELPYLMSAFNLAKTLEEDVFHFKEEEEEEKPKAKPAKAQAKPETKHFPHQKTNLPESSLYSDSQILTPQVSSPGSYLFANNSLLSKLGIKPQVITTDLPRHQLSSNTTSNRFFKQLPTPAGSPQTGGSRVGESKDTDKENKLGTPLTKANLETHNLTSLASQDMFADYVE